MSRPVKQRRNVLVIYNYANPNNLVPGGINIFLYVPFTPDEIILKYVSVANDQLGTSDLIVVSTDLVDTYNSIFFCVPNSLFTTSFYLNTSFFGGQPINRTVSFNIQYLNSTNTVRCFMSFMLEFVSYESRDDFDSSKNEVLKLKSKSKY
jgi:hypothetical protein